MAPIQKTVEPYPISPEFERALVFLACTNSAFYDRIGYALDHEALPTPAAQLCVRAVQAYAKDHGSGPTSAVLVIQRLQRWRYEGQITHEEIIAVDDLLGAAEDAGVPPEDQVVTELKPLLQRRLQSQAIKTAMDEYAKRGDFARVLDIIHRANAIGSVDRSLGHTMGASSFDLIDQLRHIERLPLGCLELDSSIGGGAARGQMTVFVGGAGGGKSMQLTHTGALSSMHGLFVAYATLELPVPIVLARLMAAITGITIDSIMLGNEDAKQRMASTPLGPLVVKDFPPQSTTVQHLQEWVAAVEQEEGRAVDVLVVDYADKLSAPTKSKKGDDNGYKAMEVVYESLRLYGAAKRMWTLTASQSTGRDRKSKLLDLSHVADSMHKVRVADLVITINTSEENDEVTYFVAKNRTGAGRKTIGPLPTDFACGLVTPIIRPTGPLGQHLVAANTAAALLEREPGSDG